MKVLLVVPRSLNPKQTYREYPLGVGMVATALRRAGHKAAVFDQNAEGPDDQRLWDRLREFAPDVVGFSIVTPSYPVARTQIARLKREEPGLTIVAGGLHANLFPEDLLEDGADVVVLGDGCEVMPRLVAFAGNGRAWKQLPGVAFRSAGKMVRTPSAALVPADDLPPIDRDVYNLPLYSHHSMLASLGCPYACTFCCNYAGTVMRSKAIVRSPDRIIAEMAHLGERYAAKRVFFVDDVFLLNRQNIRAFCDQLVAARLDMTWIAQMRVDSIDLEVAEKLVGAGCQRVYFGVESGSDAVLHRVRKGIDRQAIRQGVASAKQAGLRVKTGWVFGLPGTLEEQHATIDLMREIRPHEISIHQLIPFPGTEYYEHPARHGLRIRDPKDFASFCYGGLSDNIHYDYLPHAELVGLMERAAAVLEAEGYVNSDRATAADQYVYSTPLSATSMRVFRGEGKEGSCPST